MENTVIQKKICLLGSFAVGKTSLLRRFVYNLFDEKYLSTIGVSISRKQVQVLDDTTISMVVWDLAGGDMFTGKDASYLGGSSGAFLVCDLTRKDTFHYILDYQEQLKSVSPKAETVILANKADLVPSLEEAESEIAGMAGQIGSPYFLTSAKSGVNVDAGFQALARRLINGKR